MTFQELLKSREEEFVEKFDEEFFDLHYRFCPLFKDTTGKQEVCKHQKDDVINNINSFNRESMIAVVEFMIGEVEGMKKTELPKTIDLEIDAIGAANAIRNQGFNQALSDIITKLEQAKKEIK